MIDNTPTPIIPEPLLRLQEVARILNISKSAAYRLALTELPSIRFGRKTVRVRKADLERYISTHLSGARNE